MGAKPLSLDSLLEVFGVRSAANDGDVFVAEGKNHGRGKIRVDLRPGTNDAYAMLTPNEARYIADRLIHLADKAERKSAAPCSTCGKA